MIEVWQKPPLIRRLERRNWWIFGVMLGVSMLFCPSRFTAGIAMGGAVSVLGFYTLQRVVARALRLPLHKAPMRIILYHYTRLGLLFVVLGWVIAQRAVDPVGLLLGLSVVVLNLLLVTLVDLRKIEMEV
jgi:hypothetical protein